MRQYAQTRHEPEGCARAFQITVYFPRRDSDPRVVSQPADSVAPISQLDFMARNVDHPARDVGIVNDKVAPLHREFQNLAGFLGMNTIRELLPEWIAAEEPADEEIGVDHCERCWPREQEQQGIAELASG